VTTAVITAEELRRIDLFDELSDEQLAEWVAVAVPVSVAAGEVIAEPGGESRGAQLLLEGESEAQILDHGRTEALDRHVAPTWMGAISALTGGSLGVRMVAVTDCRLALIPAEDFRRLALAQPSVHRRVMQQVRPVVSRVTEIEQSRERLASLGTMAAGLAHELNNPAAAARSAAAQLAEALDAIGSALGQFVELGVEREEAAQLVALQKRAVEHAAAATALDTLDAADAEDELLARLEDLGVAEAWSLAAGRLAAELQESTERMSQLVSAVKSYSYMDRGELVEVDIHEGIETTLSVLGFKLKQTTIEVVRDYDRSLPKLTVRGSELNQVWTNLLDNAIDALGDSGTITITTRRDGDNCAVIEIADDGPGMPSEIVERVFDPFFTTKDVGHGTGLGLATARRIVVDRHDGSLTLDSRPGRTVFQVRLPLIA
jgi:signal transduction histidine kinase